MKYKRATFLERGSYIYAREIDADGVYHHRKRQVTPKYTIKIAFRVA